MKSPRIISSGSIRYCSSVMPLFPTQLCRNSPYGDCWLPPCSCASCGVPENLPIWPCKLYHKIYGSVRGNHMEIPCVEGRTRRWRANILMRNAQKKYGISNAGREHTNVWIGVKIARIVRNTMFWFAGGRVLLLKYFLFHLRLRVVLDTYDRYEYACNPDLSRKCYTFLTDYLLRLRTLATLTRVAGADHHAYFLSLSGPKLRYNIVECSRRKSSRKKRHKRPRSTRNELLYSRWRSLPIWIALQHDMTCSRFLLADIPVA